MKHILILEDTIEVLSVLMHELSSIERTQGEPLQLTVYTISDDVKAHVNTQPPDTFDVIILDRNCKKGGSFHELDIERFGGEKIISISSMPHLNDQACARGVAYAVEKDHRNLEDFAREVRTYVERILNV